MLWKNNNECRKGFCVHFLNEVLRFVTLQVHPSAFLSYRTNNYVAGHLLIKSSCFLKVLSPACLGAITLLPSDKLSLSLYTKKNPQTSALSL